MPENTIFSWPQDKDGNPLALVSSTIKETIPTAQYANVQLNNTVTRFVEDDKVKEGLDITYDEADAVLQQKRDEILKELNV